MLRVVGAFANYLANQNWRVAGLGFLDCGHCGLWDLVF